MDQKKREALLVFMQTAMNVSGEARLTRQEHVRLVEMYKEAVEIVNSIGQEEEVKTVQMIAVNNQIEDEK